MFLVAARAEAQLLGPPSSPNQIVVDATNVLAQSVAMPSGLPQSMLAGAQGIAIVPNMVRGAFVIGVQHGRGVLLTRGPGGAWQAPRMIQITGGSLGYQIGVQSTDLILIFRTPQSVANVLRGTLKVGVDASAAAGPVGRQASAATDLPMQAEILSYSRARGAFLGVSIDGSSISLDPATDAMYYQPPGTIPASATQLVQLLTTLSSGGPADRRAADAASGGGRAKCRRHRRVRRRSHRRRRAATDEQIGSGAAAARRGVAPTGGQSRRPVEAVPRAAGGDLHSEPLAEHGGDRAGDQPLRSSLGESAIRGAHQSAGVSRRRSRACGGWANCSKARSRSCVCHRRRWVRSRHDRPQNLSGDWRRGILGKRTDGGRNDGQRECRIQVPLVWMRCTHSIVREAPSA